jgi:cap2 methyltransferase
MAWQDPRNSPHCAQIHLNSPELEYAVGPEFHRVLTPSHPHKPYEQRGDKVRSTVHWGQRKLLLSEIEFFTVIGRAGLINSTVVYAGAAPGTHIHFLSRLFPSVRFVLVDPAPFTVRATDKITIINELFTDELAKRLAKKHRHIYFISDIRTADPSTDPPEAIEGMIQSDMRAQMRWHGLLNSKRSLLKFRLPWDDQSSEYLAGEVRLPVWGPQTTTEARLITDADPAAVARYDHKRYEGQMFYFNTVTRHSLYPHSMAGEGLDHCYDCRAEIEILSNYLTHFSFSKPNLTFAVPALSASISRQLTSHRTLLDPTPDKEDRLARIRRNQHVGGIQPCRRRHAPY